MKILRIIIIPLYIIIFFIQFAWPNDAIANSGIPVISTLMVSHNQYVMPYAIPFVGPILNLALLFLAMNLFLKRKLKPMNFILSACFITFYLILYSDAFLYIKDTTNPFDYLGGLLGLQNKWYFYGGLYTVLVTVFGISFIIRNKRTIYHIIRTIVIIFVQSVLSFLIPFISFVVKGEGKDYYFSYFWPLKIEYLYPDTIMKYAFPIVLYSFIGSLILFPIIAIFFGKRFYCSWVCGCGGLAETFGDRWRHLSDKSRAAWKFEAISIHSVLFLAVFGTILIFTDWAAKKNGISLPNFSNFVSVLRGFYGYVIGFIFAGVAGVGFYPVLGSRVWCRFFCPMAAMLGLLQKIGRYRIAVKDDMCISCGNCSTYCEMGIDVRSYAQTNKSFTRASCVGCGMCAHVCPRGVLKLENKKIKIG